MQFKRGMPRADLVRIALFYAQEDEARMQVEHPWSWSKLEGMGDVVEGLTARPRGRTRLRPQATARFRFPLPWVTTLVVIKIPASRDNTKQEKTANNDDL